MKPGQTYYWAFKEFGRVELIRPFLPLGTPLPIREWVVLTEQHTYIILPETDLVAI